MTAQIGERKPDWLEFSLLRYSELPVVPIRYVGDNKIPLQGWEYGKWKDGGQSEEDRQRAIDLFERGECDGLAIVCGTPVHIDGETFYFFAIDIDLPAEEALEAFRKTGIITRFERTLQGRLHAYFLSRLPTPNLPDMLDPETEEKVLEFKGYGKLIVVYPSRGYERLNDNPPSRVDDALEVYSKICKAFGFDLEEELQRRARKGREMVADSGVLSEWLEQIVEELDRRGLLKGKGPNYYYVLCPFHEEKHPSFAINHRKFYAVDYHDGEVYNMRELAKALGLQLATEPEIEGISRPKTKFTVGGERLPDGTWVEVVEKDGRPHLLVYKDGVFKVVESYEVDGMVYKPPPHVMFPLPRMPERLDEDPTLWEETREFIKEHFYHLDSDVYEILTAAVAWSYFYRDLRGSTPYILFLGPWGSGKSRALEVMEKLCYRAILSVDPSEASLFRSIDLFKPTLLIDESQIINPDVRAVLASGYRYGAKVMRVIDPESDGFNGIKFFNTYAFVIYASREEPPSDILSRSIVINCVKNLNQIRKRIDEARATELRTRWLAQKLRFLDRVTVTYDEFVSDNGRLQEIISPLKAMATLFGGEKAAAAVERYGRKMEAEIKALEASEPEAELVEEVARIYEERGKDAPEIIYTHELHERLKDRGWTPQLIGRRMTALGFKRYAGPGRRGYIIDPNLLANLKTRYGLLQDRLPPT